MRTEFEAGLREKGKNHETDAYRMYGACVHDRLRVCDARDGKVIDTLHFGDTLMTSQSWDGWADAAYSDGGQQPG